ncbi:vacuolar cation/proton exchanger 5-like [Bidens hawaiensis]|uniref:vacuolar cation/proton exchanger 5-like n=1 Tax=Bidens hawaiensis TaxID=980011 RepID=UPI00404B00B7
MENANNLQMVGLSSRVLSTHPEGNPVIEPHNEGVSVSLSTKRNIYMFSMNAVITSINIALLSDNICLLLPFGPLAILVYHQTSHHGWVFSLSLMGIIPLAKHLGWATEQLAFYIGPTGGELLTTFGNVTELIITICAMKHGILRVVQHSLLGSILSDMLLVLGCAFFCGGIVHPYKQQVFNKSNAVMSSGLLLMTVIGLLLPTALQFKYTELYFGPSELALSRYISCIMLTAYGGYPFFQLTSKKSYTLINEETNLDDESSDDEESPEISKYESVIWLGIFTFAITVFSEYLVSTIEGASVAMNVPIEFISVILLPIVGNATEHASAIVFAVKDKLDMSLEVTFGSSTKISMFTVYVIFCNTVLRGSLLDLNFQLFETTTLFMAVLIVAFMLQVQLFYLIIISSSIFSQIRT